MSRFWLFFVSILVISGCGTPSAWMTPEQTSTDSDPVEIQKNVYRNDRFGYAFEVPEGLAVYALTSEQTAVAASGDSDVVFLVDGETNFFTVRGIEDLRTPHEWLTQNLAFFYPTGDAAQRVGEIAGEQAIFLHGMGTSTSPAQLIVLSLNGTLLVISYEQNTSSFEAVVESFSAI